MKLSIIIPVYNEEKTIEQVINGVMDIDIPFEKEVIVVDDGSGDNTRQLVGKIRGVRLIAHKQNRGKGAALRTGFKVAGGDIILIQDADLEYDLKDYHALLRPFIEGRADVVYGSRFRGQEQRVFYFWHYVGNKLITLFSDMLTNLNLSDVYVCYKVFRKEVVQTMLPRLRSGGFAIEAEMTSRIAHSRRSGSRLWRIYEVPISYYGRTYGEGKKIRWSDGLWAVLAIVYFNVFNR